jgi:hypothetical protein
MNSFPTFARILPLLRKTCLVILLLNIVQASRAAEINIYYTAVEMPSGLQNNYYAQYDPKMLALDAAALLQKATGQQFSVMPYRKGVTAGIFLMLDSTYQQKSNEAGTLDSDGKSFIRIRARYATGLSYTLYSWLQEMGFRFYLPGEEWTYTPAIKKIFSKKIKSKLYQPAFKMRMMGASGGIYAVKGIDEKMQNAADWRRWHQRNRMGCDYVGVDGHIGEYFNIVHKKEIESDSLIIAPVNGRRRYSTAAKLDPTYKKGVQLFAEWISKEARLQQKNQVPFLPLKKYYTADAGDGLDYCHTEACEAAFRSVSDQSFSIVNAAAEKIRTVDSRLGVSSMAYTERADTPSISIAPNVHVMVVPGAFQSVSTAAELMLRWSKKHNKISQYDYLNIGVWAYDMPFFNLSQYHSYLQFLQRLKVEGLQYETSLSKFASGIPQYFILQFLANPYTDINVLLDEFCRKNFEGAAAPVKALLKEWYFSNTHLQTNYDRPAFYSDELGRFFRYMVDAEKTPALSAAARYRITELKAYLIYLCKYYELFADLESLSRIAENKELKSKQTKDLLNFTWQLYQTKIFHNTQLNDVLKQYLNENERAAWDYHKMISLENPVTNTEEFVEQLFVKYKNRYLPQAQDLIKPGDDFMAANIRYSADSFLISTMDETAFGNFVYPLSFYCNGKGTVKISYKTGSSQKAGLVKNKVAMVALESSDYRLIKNTNITSENSEGNIILNIPLKGHYKVYLSQYNATPVTYSIQPRNCLFYLNKKSIMMNGLLLQNNELKEKYPNKFLAIYAPAKDSLYFSNLYHSSNNTSRWFTESGIKLEVKEHKNKFYNAVAIPANRKSPFLFYENIVYRWPPVLKNTADYYFFLRYPLY